MPASACEWHLSSCCPLEELVLGLHKRWIRGAIDISPPYQLVHLRVSSTRNRSLALELWSHANAFATGRSLQVQELLQGRTRGAVDVVSKNYLVHLRRPSSTTAPASEKQRDLTNSLVRTVRNTRRYHKLQKQKPTRRQEALLQVFSLRLQQPVAMNSSSSVEELSVLRGMLGGQGRAVISKKPQRKRQSAQSQRFTTCK